MRTLLPAWLLLAAPLAAGAQEPAPRVAVIPFGAFSVTLEDAAAIGQGLTDMMITELSTRPRVQVIERQALEQLAEARKLSLSGRGDDRTALQIGQLLGAQYIVVGSVALEKKQARLDVRILEVETGAVHRAERVTGKREEMLSLVEKLADSFTRDLKLPAARVAAAPVPVAATIAYSRGLDYERRGMAERAAGMYRRALELFPEHPEAARALDRVKKGAE